jgi:hypothetical protein
MASEDNIKMADLWAKAALLALEGDIELWMNLTNGTNPFGRRMLAEDDLLELSPVADGTAGALPAGEDNQLDVTELDDITEIDQAEPTKDIEAINNVPLEDQGRIGDDSDVNNDTGSSGTSFMTWVMYIGGAILVMALIAGACYLLMQNKDANDFSHEQNNTEMSNPTYN